MDEFYTKLAEILEVDEVREDSQLESFPAWDSLGVLAAIAMIDSSYGVNLTSTELTGVKTVGEFARLVESRRKA
jgi:acyl carrier protein